jgi:putative transposase
MTNIREKKHRLPREAYRGRVTVSITACIADRRTPFVDDGIVKVFVEKLLNATTKWKCQVPIYCFMPDHLHLILHGTDDTADAWQAMVDFKQQTGFWFGRQRPEFSWQKDFHDHIIRSNEDLGAHCRYVADNPVRRGLVHQWREYCFTGSIGVDLREIMADTATL